MSLDMETILKVRADADCLFTKSEVEAAISKIAANITSELADKNLLVFCVLNGGLIFAGQLLTKLDFPLEVSYLHATRYLNETSGGELFWKAKPEVSFIDRNILIIDIFM